MSFKNKLQEIIQRDGGPIPKYITSRIGGTEHQPIFKSLVIYTLSTVANKACGKEARNKKEAEQSAAQKAIQQLSLQPNSPRLRLDSTDQIYILIDLENVDIKKFMNKYSFNDYVDVYGFISEHHPQSDNKIRGVNVIKVPSSRPDAADVGMIMYATQISLNQLNSSLILVSNDRIFCVLKECLVGTLLDSEFKEVILVSTPKKLELSLLERCTLINI